MSRSRMFGPTGEGDEGAGPASPRTTIVGGRPPESKAGLPPVPIGLERLLRLAATDAAFAAELVARRADVAGAAGVELTRSEAAILAAIPAAQLEAMIARVPPPAPPRREFLQLAAASAVVALGGAALASCDACPMTATRGIQPDLPPARPVVPPTPPPPRPEVNEMQSEGGAAPDLPPPRPDASSTEDKAGAEPDAPSQSDASPTPGKRDASLEAPRPRPHVSLPTKGIRPDDPEDFLE